MWFGFFFKKNINLVRIDQQHVYYSYFFFNNICAGNSLKSKTIKIYYQYTRLD